MPSGGTTQPGPLTIAVAAILNRAFKQTSVSQKQLGAVVGISQSQMSKLLRGERVLNVDQLEDLCFALGLDIGDVVHAAARFAHPH